MFLLYIYIFFSLVISRLTLKANIFNIASISLICYWAAYPLEKLKIQDYTTISGIREVGVYMYAIFGFSFLLGAFIISKIKIKRINIYPRINSRNNLFFISLVLAFLGLFCFTYTYNFSISNYIYLTLGGIPRGERMALISQAKNALPYSIFFIPSITTLLIAIKKFGISKTSPYKFLTIVIIFLNTPILLSYLAEGDRSSLIKFLAVLFFTLCLSQNSIEKINKRSFLIEKLQINKTILLNRIKIFFILFSFCIIFMFVGYARSAGWTRTPYVFRNISNSIKDNRLPTGEFRGVNFTIDFALARNHLSIKKTDKMFTWDRLIFYPLPTYVYKAIFNSKKPLNMGDAIGLETGNYIFGNELKKKYGFGLSPIAEGLINFGIIGVFINGFIYGSAISLLQYFYNKISLDSINLLDIIIINTLTIIPLIMRAGNAGIYNWIFSTSFVLLLPLLVIEFFHKINHLNFFTKQNDEINK